MGGNMSPLIISIIFLSSTSGHFEYGFGTCAVKAKTCTEKNTLALNSPNSSRDMARNLLQALHATSPLTNSSILYTDHISDREIELILKEIEKKTP